MTSLPSSFLSRNSCELAERSRNCRSDNGQRPDAARAMKQTIDVPIFRLPQLLGLAFGLSPKTLGLDRHVVATRGALERIALKV
jgi:heterodisulfide reductase subunit B